MKSDFSRRFYGQVLVNILYSTLVACLVEIFLIANVDMIVNYLEKTQGSLSPALKIFRMGTATTILYVIAGIGIFSLTFLLLQRKSIRYIGKIAAAIQNISEGDLNIQVEVEGDDEFAMMAASLNRMEADIRELMDKERESERTKNELITNVAHDLRTPLTPSSATWSCFPGACPWRRRCGRNTLTSPIQRPSAWKSSSRTYSALRR